MTMKMFASTCAAGSACLLSLSAIAANAAEQSPTASHASAAALLGYGAKDGVGIGLGVRVGYTLLMNAYLGGTFVYHLGKNESSPFGEVSSRLYYFGAEGGYDINLVPCVIRPYVGLGVATATLSFPGGIFGGTTVPSTSTSDRRFALWPGGTVLFPFGSAFVGGDARFLIGSDFNTFSAFATGGLQF